VLFRLLSFGRRSVLLGGVFALLVVSPCACRRAPPEPEPAPVSPAAEAIQKAEPSAVPAASASPAAIDQHVEDRAYLGPGWSKLSLEDSLPICVFPNTVEREAAQLFPLAKKKKQTLKADSTVTFGVFPPWCLDGACDALPNLQCWTELQDGNTIVVHSRFFSFHKDHATCTHDCMEVDTSCDTPVLPAGKYSVRHGDQMYRLKLPSVMRDPCLTPESQPPP
jgi:hypothetical protein